MIKYLIDDTSSSSFLNLFDFFHFSMTTTLKLSFFVFLFTCTPLKRESWPFGCCWWFLLMGFFLLYLLFLKMQIKCNESKIKKKRFFIDTHEMKCARETETDDDVEDNNDELLVWLFFFFSLDINLHKKSKHKHSSTLLNVRSFIRSFVRSLVHCCSSFSSQLLSWSLEI